MHKIDLRIRYCMIRKWIIIMFWIIRREILKKRKWPFKFIKNLKGKVRFYSCSDEVTTCSWGDIGFIRFFFLSSFMTGISVNLCLNVWSSFKIVSPYRVQLVQYENWFWVLCVGSPARNKMCWPVLTKFKSFRFWKCSAYCT